jgi:AAA domain-containing protein
VEDRASGFLGPFRVLLDGRLRSSKRRWATVLLPGASASLLDQAADFRQVPKWQGARDALGRHAEAGVWFGAAWRGADSDWTVLEGHLVWLGQFATMVSREPLGDAGYTLAAAGGIPDGATSVLRTQAQELDQGLPKLVGLIMWPEGYFADATVIEIQGRLGELLAQADKGPSWAAFVAALGRLQGSSAHPCGEAAFRGEISAVEVGRSFRRSLFGAWLEQVIPTDPVLSSFGAAAHESHGHTFRDVDTRIQDQNRVLLIDRVRANNASAYAGAPGAHKQFLQREMAKQKRHRPLRQTLREAHAAIRALKPCFMMSPLSVAQFLPATAWFDLVIFDEASQLPTEDAVGAFCRGGQLVVVGDPKQLPPTNFFAVQSGAIVADLDEDNEPVLDETESVLEECMGAGLHQAYLEWHYRSAHEHLIQFSNDAFYNGRLIVFPAAVYDGPELGLQFVHDPTAAYHGAGYNPKEAETVADAVIQHFKSHPEESLGVGTSTCGNRTRSWTLLSAAGGQI